MVRLEHIHKTYGSQPVLEDLTLELEPGERFVLLGPSGCGKTTLLRLIAGFERPDAGHITIGNEDVSGWPVERRPVGVIFQNPALFPHMTVEENIEVGPRVRGLPDKERVRRREELLEMTRLTSRRRAWPGQLSGGEAQRVALARAVINRPKLLLLDEPLSALDESLRRTLRDELMTMQEAFGLTFLFVTHDREEAMTLAHRLGILHAGRTRQVDSPEVLYHRPRDPFVARFLGDFDSLPGVVIESSDGWVRVRIEGGGRLRGRAAGPLPVETPVLAGIRPEQVRLLPPGAAASEENLLRGRIRSVAFLGHLTRLRVEMEGGGFQQVLVPATPSAPSRKQGEPVVLHWPPEQVRVFPEVLDG